MENFILYVKMRFTFNRNIFKYSNIFYETFFSMYKKVGKIIFNITI